jgi:hypothetical protein
MFNLPTNRHIRCRPLDHYLELHGFDVQASESELRMAQHIWSMTRRTLNLSDWLGLATEGASLLCILFSRLAVSAVLRIEAP